MKSAAGPSSQISLKLEAWPERVRQIIVVK